MVRAWSRRSGRNEPGPALARRCETSTGKMRPRVFEGRFHALLTHGCLARGKRVSASKRRATFIRARREWQQVLGRKGLT